MFSYFSICTENGIFVLLSFLSGFFSVILEVNGNKSIFKSALISDNTFESVYFAQCSLPCACLNPVAQIPWLLSTMQNRRTN